KARDDHWARAKREWQGDVLATKPWNDMEWAHLDEQLARFTNVTEPNARAFLAALRAWRNQLTRQMTDTRAAILLEAERIRASTPENELRGVVSAHPLSALLFQPLRGRLDEAAFRKQCRTARKLGALGSALALPPVELPVYAR